MLTPKTHDFSREPETINRLNANAFQQSAITSFRGHQYCAFYRADKKRPKEVRYVVLARRNVVSCEKWEFLEFEDYEQKTDDGHNTISIGICRGDGTIHVAFDHHSDELKYRVSEKSVASQPEKFKWVPSLFSIVLHQLSRSSYPTDLPAIQLVTYPRFVNVNDGLLFECRIGRAGAGSDVLYSYDAQTASFDLIGTYLIGVKSNPYPNGLTYDQRSNRLHVSWTNRHFVEYEGSNDPNSTAHKAQVGPNGPENNQDLCYASSGDMGRTWQLPGSFQAVNAMQRGIIGTNPEAVAVSIPRNSGIMNQEAQCIDNALGFHVLNRENTDGEEKWRHYHLIQDAKWITTTMPFLKPTTISQRGKIVHDPEMDMIYFLLPTSIGEKRLSIIRGKRLQDKRVGNHELVWIGEGYDGEPLVDEQAISELGILCILTTRELLTERRLIMLEFLLKDLGEGDPLAIF